MIPNEKDGIICSKKLPALLRGITSKNNGGFYCSNCLNSFITAELTEKRMRK